MPPEEPNGLVALRLDVENGRLICRGERVFPKHRRLRVSWYTATAIPPEGYMAILDGVVFVYRASVANTVRVDRFCPTQVADRYLWRDHASMHGLMIALVLPAGQTLAYWEPQLIEAKRFSDRAAVFWLLYPAPDADSSVYPPAPGADSSVKVCWSLADFGQGLDSEVERLNRAISLACKRETAFDYDVALSFAGEDREYVEEVARALVAAGAKVFYDRLEEADLWGKNLYSHLSDVYRTRARFTVMFISRWYAEKQWTNFEREAAQARAFAESREYILPVRFDDTEIPGIPPVTAYIRANERPPDQLAAIILHKLESTLL